jgi:hypothetical protein
MRTPAQDRANLKYREKNREKIAAKRREKYRENPQYDLDRQRKYRKEISDYYKEREPK